MLGCLLECEMEFGPPPDLILGIPPPPIPSFLRDPVEYLVTSNGSCDLCVWAKGDDAQLMQIISKYPVIEDLWYFGILSAAIGLVLIGVLIFVAALRCREAKVKPVHQESCKNSSVEKVHSEPEIIHHSLGPLSQFEEPGNGSKCLWSSLKSRNSGGGEGGGYALQHQSLDPYQLPVYEKVDYGSIVYSCPMVPKPMERCYSPPPLPAVPPPPFCPSLNAMKDDPHHHQYSPHRSQVMGGGSRGNPGYYEHVVLRGNKYSSRLPMVTRIHDRPNGRSAPV